MKECPICHTQYDDTQKFCINDGHELISQPTEDQRDIQKEQEKPRAAEKPHAAEEPHSAEQASSGNSGGGQQTTNTSSQPRNNGCMKKIIIGIAVLVVAFIGIYYWSANATTYLRLEPKEFVADKGGGKTTIGIDYDGYVWTVNHKPVWVELKEDDRSFELTFAPNTSGKPREGTITIQSGKQRAQLEVSQKAVATYIEPSVTNLQFSIKGGRKEVVVKTDGARVISNSPQFLKIDSTATGFIIKVPRNDGDYREGTIVLSEDNVNATIGIQQGGKCPYCHGNGVITCANCQGTGTIVYGMYYYNCRWCGGSGGINCNTCGQTGKIDIPDADDEADVKDEDD